MPLLISSLENPKIKEASHLRERRYRNKLSLFLIEGYRELDRAVIGNVEIERLFICKELFLGENEDALIDKVKATGAEIIPCTKKVFSKISYRDRPDGLIAVAKSYKNNLQFLESVLSKKKNPPLIVVCEAIEKPGNLGTIIRSCDAAGIDGLIVADRVTDLFNPNVIRASTGILFTLPICEATSDETLSWLALHNIQTIAARPQAQTLYTDIDMRQGIAIAVGTEQLGLSEAWQQRASLSCKIPMLGTADSLNVAQATTLLLYEAVRQRQSEQNG